MAKAVPCVACAKAVPTKSVSCAHCGVRQRAADMTDVELTPEQVRALLAVNGVARPMHVDAPSPGLFGGLVLPHPMTHGTARGAEIVLSVVGGPVIVSALGLLALLARTRGRIYDSEHSELGKLSAVVVCGAPVYGWLLAMSGVPIAGWLTLVGVSCAALAVRYMIRRGAAAGSPLDLDALAEPEPEPEQAPRARPPKAKALKAPPVALTKAKEPPKPVKEYAPGDEPHFLK